MRAASPLTSPLDELQRRVDALFCSAKGRVGPGREDLERFCKRLEAIGQALLREHFPPADQAPPPKRQRRETLVLNGSCERLRENVQELVQELGEDGVYETCSLSIPLGPNCEVRELAMRQFRRSFFSSGCRLWDSSIALARWLCAQR